MGFKLEGKRTTRLGFTYSNLANLAGRVVQIIFACVVIGMVSLAQSLHYLVLTHGSMA